jgi:hypothetical protein
MTVAKVILIVTPGTSFVFFIPNTSEWLAFSVTLLCSIASYNVGTSFRIDIVIIVVVTAVFFGGASVSIFCNHFSTSSYAFVFTPFSSS